MVTVPWWLKMESSEGLVAGADAEQKPLQRAMMSWSSKSRRTGVADFGKTTNALTDVLVTTEAGAYAWWPTPIATSYRVWVLSGRPVSTSRFAVSTITIGTTQSLISDQTFQGYVSNVTGTFSISFQLWSSSAPLTVGLG